MEQTPVSNPNRRAIIPVIIATAVLAAMAALTLADQRVRRIDSASELYGGIDKRPIIDLFWSPESGPVDLKDFQGMIGLHDDHELDLATYELELVDLGVKLDIPNGAALLAKDYELPLYLWVYADDPKLVGKERFTIRIAVADKAGQYTRIERFIPLTPATQQD